MRKKSLAADNRALINLQSFSEKFSCGFIILAFK